MDRESLFRLALVTHVHAPKTVTKYILLMAKLEVMRMKELSFTPARIAELIKASYDLEFSEEEVKFALRGDHDFEFHENGYCLRPEAFDALKKSQETPPIEEHVEEFLHLFYDHMTAEEKNSFREIVMKYMYHCFSSGRKTLSSLLSRSAMTGEYGDFRASEAEKEFINAFLDWDNAAKNQCVYSIVSYCLDYGMLTSKMDLKEGKHVFSGISFILDANIIFRLVGMNNLERQQVIAHFIRKCRQVGISLNYTNFTYLETMRVVNNIARQMRLLNNGDRPISPAALDKLGDYDHRDTYVMYYEWSKASANRFDDYDAFADYLREMVNTCFDQFIRIDLYNAGSTGAVGAGPSFDELVNSLLDYKTQRSPHRSFTLESARTDVNNFLHASQPQSERGSRVFLITADRRLYEWAQKTLPGVPAVFMPSEWLSVILKFTSRTEADYETFSKFMNLRFYDAGRSKQNAMQVLQSINELTSDVDLKQRVIKLVSEKMLHLEQEAEDTTEVVHKAFDEILQQQNEQSQVTIHELETKHQIELDHTREATQRETAIAFAEKNVDDRIRRWAWFRERRYWSASCFGGLVFLILLWSRAADPAIEAFCNSRDILAEKEFDLLQIVSLILAGLTGLGFDLVVGYCCSEKRRDKLIRASLEKLGIPYEVSYSGEGR